MGSSFQQGRDQSNAGSLLESARLLTSNAAELLQCAKTSRAHIAAIRSEIEQIRISAARTQQADLQAREEHRSDTALELRAEPSLRDPHDPQGRKVIMTALLVVLIGIIRRTSRRQP